LSDRSAAGARRRRWRASRNHHVELDELVGRDVDDEQFG
jgi:hypothetical protein